jgi:hypothetical protein
MNRLRFTIAGLMAIVLFVAIGFAALRNADELWASATYTLAIAMISLAFVGAFVRKGKARAIWSGFAVFGLAYLLIGLSPQLKVVVPLYFTYTAGQRPTPVPLIQLGLHRLQPYVNPIPAGAVGSIPYDQVSHSLGIVLFGFIGAVMGRLLAVTDDCSDPSPLQQVEPTADPIRTS